MTNQIKKLYENVGLDNLWVERYDSNGIEHENWYPSYKVMIKSMMEKNDWTLKEAQNVAKKECHKELLPFTAEKQIELIKWFIHSRHFSHIRFNIKWVVDDIANHINFIWQNLTEEEKQQIKEILK